jgi:selenide,water dikinase
MILVLVGGGHSHALVLEALAAAPLVGMETHLVVDRPQAVYSGMVPGLIAEQYRRQDVEIDVAHLARRAGVHLHLEPMIGIDADARTILLPDAKKLRYDVAAIDIGSSTAGLDLEGVRQHALPTRPMQALLDGIETATLRAQKIEQEFRIVVVGGGAGGVELAFCLDARIAADSAVSTCLVTDGARVLPGYGDAFIERIQDEAARREIRIVTGRRAERLDEHAVVLDDGSRLPYDFVVWATGAVGPAVFQGTGLPLDDKGFVHVDDTLRVEGHDALFAVGDCATLRAYPDTPKAGVYAVRQGPVLLRNLRSWQAGRDLERFRPQSDFLRLLNLGDGRAVGGKWQIATSGRWVMRLKDRIDRRFMARLRR